MEASAVSEDGRINVSEWWRKERVISVELTIHSQYEDEEDEEDGYLDWHTTAKAMATVCACSYQPWTIKSLRLRLPVRKKGWIGDWEVGSWTRVTREQNSSS